GFSPALDDAGHRESGGLAALVGTVKFLAVEKRPTIVADDGVGGRGLRAGAFLQDLVLQAAGERDNTIFRFVGGQESFPFLLVRLGGLLPNLLLLLAHIVLERRESGLGLLVRQECVA